MMLTMRIRMLALGAVAAVIAIPGTAAAQEDGVFYDDDSSAGKEYAIPHEQAREGAGGGAGPGGGGSSGGSGGETGSDSGAAVDPDGAAEPGADPAAGSGLFGEGISRGENGDGSVQPQAGAAIRSAAAQDGGSALGWVLGIGGAVLALGLLVGFGSKRLTGTQSGGLRRLLRAR